MNPLEQFMAVIFVVAITTVCALVFNDVGSSAEKDRAIKAGVAHYVLVDPSTGKTEFRYKECK